MSSQRLAQAVRRRSGTGSHSSVLGRALALRTKSFCLVYRLIVWLAASSCAKVTLESPYPVWSRHRHATVTPIYGAALRASHRQTQQPYVSALGIHLVLYRSAVPVGFGIVVSVVRTATRQCHITRLEQRVPPLLSSSLGDLPIHCRMRRSSFDDDDDLGLFAKQAAPQVRCGMPWHEAMHTSVGATKLRLSADTGGVDQRARCAAQGGNRGRRGVADAAHAQLRGNDTIAQADVLQPTAPREDGDADVDEDARRLEAAPPASAMLRSSWDEEDVSSGMQTLNVAQTSGYAIAPVSSGAGFTA
jgi:hypothetical protein